jgi:hypothetical protein
MTLENPKIPAWAQRERQSDHDWISENLHLFWMAALAAFEDAGRGAIVVDTTLEPISNAGNPFAYCSQEQVEQQGSEDVKRMVTEYDPTHELILVLLKSDDRISTYRVDVTPSGLVQENGADDATPDRSNESTAQPKLKPPTIETLMEWEAEGGCEAACPHGCWVEPDGTCPHGNPSWLLKLGLI